MKVFARDLFAAVAFAAAFTFAEAAVEVGRAAPDFTLIDSNGKTHQLSDYLGQVVVLEWVNPGCPIVQAHYKARNMQGTQQMAAEQGVVWLQIHTAAERGASDKEAADWNRKMGARTTAWLKDTTGKVGRQYGARTTPHMFIINKDGTLAYQGAIDSGNSRNIPTAKNYVKAALAALAAGKPVEMASTKPYGCAIKYPPSDT